MEEFVRSLKGIIGRHFVAELIAVLSILAACSDYSTTPLAVNTGGQSSTVDVAFCADQAPSWVAFQDGDGAWTQAQPTTAGTRATFHHTFTSNRAAIAAARRFSGLTTLSVWFGLPSELPAGGDADAAHCGSLVSKALLGTIAGVDTNELAVVSSGEFSSAFLFHDGTRSFILSGLDEGPQSILATRSKRIDNRVTLDRLILRRIPALPDSAMLSVFDFNSAESFAPAVANVTIQGLGADGAVLNTMLLTANSRTLLAPPIPGISDVTHPYNAIPVEKLADGDLQRLTIVASPTAPSVLRSSSIFFHFAIDQTVTLGPIMAGPTITVAATTPALRPTASFPPQDTYDRSAQIVYQRQNTELDVTMTSAYAALIGGYTLTVPDFSGVSGFDPQLALHAGGSVFWSAARVGGTLGLGPAAVPFNGATQRFATSTGSFDP
jgi:hypothetical protein